MALAINTLEGERRPPLNGNIPIAAIGTSVPENCHHIHHPRYPTTREEWTTFPVTRTKYDDGVVKGERLMIGGWSVMEEWEKNMEQLTVARLLNDLPERANILIRGEGLGYCTEAFIRGLSMTGGGEIHVIELHPEILEQGRKRTERILKTFPPHQKESIKMVWNKGDALKVTRGLRSNYFHRVRSDTFPLSKSEKDVNDVIDRDEIIRIMTDSGAFSPYVGHRSATPEQLAYMNTRYFRHIEQFVVPVTPPRDCHYYKDTEMAIMICKGPRKGEIVFQASK